MEFLKRYKIVLKKDYPFINTKWLEQEYGLKVGYEYPCIGFSKTADNLPITIHLIVNDRIASPLYDEALFELINEN